MAKPVKSQWDFGELFPREQLEPARKIWTVAALTTQIRNLLETQVGQVWVMGEVTNLKSQSSGHLYFTLKDATAQVSCVLFRGEGQADRSLLQDGRKVTLQGHLTVYEVRGQYQLRVTAVELQGLGALQAAFEKLKAKLNAEGLFAQARKRPLARYPQRIGLVTSPTSAAIRDVIHVIERRNPALEIILVPCRVQGEGAAEEIAAAIRNLNQFAQQAGRLGAPIDLILVTRGGGSLEDLWAFNEEAVARAIYESKIPIVSAIGHEIDFTISDFVADIRAATPSAAAEIITQGIVSSAPFILQAGRRMQQLALQHLAGKKDELKQALQDLARHHPRRRFYDLVQKLDDLLGSLARGSKQGIRQQKARCQSLFDRLSRMRPALLVRQRRDLVEREAQRLREQFGRHLGELKHRLNQADSRLRLLGPEQVLARGYSITMNAETGVVIRDANEVKPGLKLKTRLKRGEILSRKEA